MSSIDQERMTPHYPKLIYVRGVVLRWILCCYCLEHVWLNPDDRLSPHMDFYLERWCEGGNRHYWHMYGTRLDSER